MTIDYRDILAETVLRRLGNTNLDLVFPGLTPSDGLARSGTVLD